MKKYALAEVIPASVEEELSLYSPLIRRLLYNRGLHKRNEAEAFLKPDYETLHNAHELKDVVRAVERIKQALDAHERIAIYSDYDTDGVPGAVILHDLFRKIGYDNFTNYIPHRNNEGFGLNTDAIDTLASEGVTLLITIDCGSTDTQEVAHAKESGMEVIITDHHLIGTTAPDAYAIVNPKQDTCVYPEEMLCGAAVIFKLVQVFLSQYGEEYGVPKGWEKWLLDMVGIATLSDMVPLVGENRVLAHYGLMVLRKTRRAGLQQLLGKVRIAQHTLTEEDVGFTIGPRINAASRMGVPLDAFRMLAASSVEEASAYVEHLEKINRERKGLVATMVRELHKRIKAQYSDALPDVLVFGNPDWKPSLLGLVANKLMEEYARPVFLWGRESGTTLKGSCRSNGVDVVVLMESLPEGMLSACGGHSLAGGFAVSAQGVHMLGEELNKAYVRVQSSTPHDAPEGVRIDADIHLDEVREDMYREIVALAPFGVGNPKPLFRIDSITPERVAQFGKGSEHLEITARNSAGRDVRAIAFFARPDRYEHVPEEGKPCTLIAHMEKNTFRGANEVRLRIVDVI